MTSDGDRISQYQQHVADMQSTAQLYDLLAALQDHTFRIKPEAQIAAYFQQHELHYEQDDDIDVLSRFLADEIAKREGNDRMQKLVETNIGRRSLERLIGQNVNTYKASLQELDKLEEPMQQLFETLYERLKSEEGTVIIPQQCVGPSFKGNLFYRVEGKKVTFGICGDESYLWGILRSEIQSVNPDYRYEHEKVYGVQVTIQGKDRSIVRFGRIPKDTPLEKITTITYTKIITKNYDNGIKSKQNPSFTVNSFLHHIKTLLQTSKDASLMLEYLNIILSFPNLLNRGLAARQLEINRNLKAALTTRQEIEVVEE